ncbi:hypothetical protein ES332_D07G177300v1 [Gossypium tomentosum]|uniref:Uncharacterized protein n=1 Tax=Gossypium tomentosum TaxID=34277 RepID=A0A5D2K8X0_GOSTO|nr:hypothetical protein ES332_D07G177300v1 [Gossypium tomentosum]
MKNNLDLQDSLQNIERIIKKQNFEQVARNQLQLNVSIDVIKWLVFQGCTFRECFICEQLFDLVHVKKTTSLALEKEICKVLLCHCLNVDDIHGQGYDGASNMHGEWNNLLALFTKKSTSKEVIPICQFFSYLTGIINLVASSSKRHDQLRDIEASHITKLIDSGVLEIGKGKNQVGTLQRPGDTQWRSHLASLNSLMRMFNSVCVVLQDIIKFDNLTQMNKADGINDAMAFVEFVFILHFMIEMFGITDDLYQALRYKLQDILNMRQLNLTIEHHYQFDIFIVGIDSLLAEMNSLFNDEVVELLILIFTLDPRDDYKSFRKASTVAELCQVLAKKNKSSIYPLLDRIIQLVLTLPTSTATIERAFSAMKIMKTSIHNRMKDDFLSTW